MSTRRFASGAARRTRTGLSTTVDPATDGARRTRRPTPRRQATRRAATLAAIRGESR